MDTREILQIKIHQFSPLSTVEAQTQLDIHEAQLYMAQAHYETARNFTDESLKMKKTLS